MSNLSVENVYTRQTAKELTRKHFWKLLGMEVILFGIVYATLMVGSALLSLIGSEAIAMIGSIVLMAVMVLVGSGLGMGLRAAMIDLCRNDETVTVGRLFSRMGQTLKAFGLSLWIYLKIFLWALPAYAVVILGMASVLLASTSTTNTFTGGTSIPLDPESATITLSLLPFIGMILIFALVIPAAFRYLLSAYVLADKPETGVFECVKQSKAMMKGHKWQAVKLTIPIILVMLVLMMVVMFVMTFILAAANSPAAAVVMGIVMFVVIMVMALYFGIRMDMCFTLFYLKRCEKQEPAEAPAEEPAQAE